MHCVYVLLEEEKRRFYIGYSANLKRRVREHRGDRVHTTSRYDSKELIFYESFQSKQDALRREKYFKTTKGKKALRLMLRDTLKIAKQ